MAYLDNAAAALPSPSLVSKIKENLFAPKYSNPHSHHAIGESTNQMIESVRRRICHHFKTTSDEYAVVFTANTTHALHIIAENFDFGRGSSTSQAKIRKVDELIGTSFAYLLDSHHSVVGMREVVKNRVDSICCVEEEDFDRLSKVSRNSLFVLTSMSNFNGKIYPMDWIHELHEKGWTVCADVASLVSSNIIDLSKCKPDFVCFSFYKIFGYPTGIGSLLIRKSSVEKLKKKYFAGGTVSQLLPRELFFKNRNSIEESFEDGTVNFYSIAALKYCFEDLDEHGGIEAKGRHTMSLYRNAKNRLRELKHDNGQRLVEIYENVKLQDDAYGPIIAFNLKNSDESYIGYSQVDKMANLFGIQLRTGCHCNMGACQLYLGITDDILKKLSASGKECGDQMDLVDGLPTGGCRISFGKTNIEKDIDVLIQMLESCFLIKNPTVVLPPPLPLHRYSPTITRLFTYPIKSCNGIEFDSIDCTSTGLKYDRNLMVAKDGIGLTLKKTPELCRIQVHIEDDHILHLTTENDDIELKLDLNDVNSFDENENVSKLCGREQTTASCKNSTAKWFETTIGYENCELRRITEDSSKSLSNSCPYLLVNEASLSVLAEAINMSLNETLIRFRPNIVIRGIPPFSEDTIKQLRIGNLTFEVVDKCSRCEMICVDPQTGIKDPNLIVALRNIRYKQKMTFGIYLRQCGYTKGSLNVGTSVSLEENC